MPDTDMALSGGTEGWKLSSKTAAVPEIKEEDIRAAIDRAIQHIRGPRDRGVTAYDWLNNCLQGVGISLRWIGKKNVPANARLADYIVTAHYDPWVRVGRSVGIEWAEGFNTALGLRKHQSVRELNELKERIVTLAVHERVHEYQHQRLKEDSPDTTTQYNAYNSDKALSYLARPAEIGAYAVHAVHELRKAMSDADILKHLRTYNNPGSRAMLTAHSIAFLKYTNMDDYVQKKRNNPGDVDKEYFTRDVLRELVQKMVQYIQQHH